MEYKPMKIGLDRRTLLAGIFLLTIVGSVAFILVAPEAVNRSQFLRVVEYIDQDSRNLMPLTYASPNISSSGWSIAEYHWLEHGLVDWEQVDLFLNELEYYGAPAYWCDYYRIAPDDRAFRWFIWFQTSETDFVFLYPTWR
jgi:hypothetical protein